jgi:NADH-quinone oxidoreductase subunit A
MVFTWLQAAILLFFLGGVLFGAGPLLGSLFLAPKARGGAMGATYECGVPTHGRTWVKFGINYYFYALIFLAFEVDILYLFPVATWFNKSVGFAPVWKILVFLGVLGLAVVYFQRKGVFEWPRRIQISPRR